MSGTHKISTIGPFLEEFAHERNHGGFFTFGEIVGVNIEDDVLEKILELHTLVVDKIAKQLSHDFGLEDHLLDDVNNGVMVAPKSGGKVTHFQKKYLLFGNLPLKTQTVLKLTELLHELHSLQVEVSNTSCDLSLL